ncbi:MAG: NAD(P)-dependent oxidoreductase [Acidobacteria bacterium]|nr:NAD(P)-dependent oxidoreductase [Acidobacteriota bacterium]
MQGEKILITGPAGQVAFPIARALAADNEVWGIARFGKDADRERVEAAGVRCVKGDLARGAFDGLPDDFTYVLHLAVVHSFTPDFEHDLEVNVEGTGLLMAHCRKAKAFLHCSSTAVYEAVANEAFKESDPLGDNNRGMMPTYSICKIASESMARYGARQWNLPTVIARLNVPYGANGGWPSMHLEMMLAGRPIAVGPGERHVYNPIHEDDVIAHIPRLLDVAGVPAVTLNWGGSETASIEEWCAWLSELTGVDHKIVFHPAMLQSIGMDTTRMHELIGSTTVQWKDGFRRMVEARHPELLADRS